MSEEIAKTEETPEGTSLDALESQISEMESAIDNASEKPENVTNDADSNKSEEASEIAARIEALESENKRLIDMVGRLIVVNGARISSEKSEGVKAFPSSVEPALGEMPEITPLSDIKLGS